jgi:large subunit ribosomal protein L9
MRIILLSDVPGTGHAGDLLEVKEGYARNYLLPKGLAEIPSGKAAKKIMQDKAEKAVAEKRQQNNRDKAITALDGRKVTLSVKINAQGHLYRAITEKDLAKELGIEPKLVEDINLKKVGKFEVKIKNGRATSIVILDIKPEK